MKFKITLGQKLTAGFGFISATFLLFIVLTSSLLADNERINKQISKVSLPSESSINQLRIMLNNSKMLIKNWVHIDQKSDTPDKLKLKDLLNTDFPELKESLLTLKTEWHLEDQIIIDTTIATIEDTLFVKYGEIMDQLSTFESYDDPMIAFFVYPLLEDDGEVSLLIDKILKQLEELHLHIAEETTASTLEMEQASSSFRNFIIVFGSLALILSVSIGFFLTQSITRPIVFVRDQLEQISKGEISNKTYKKLSDEIGEMLVALTKLRDVFIKMSAFSQEIGKGNYDAEYKPAGKKDVLGNSLVSLKDSLEKASIEAEERREADRISNWTTNGLANFAELLRKSNNITILSKSIITELVNYMDVNQGGIFVINEVDKNDVHLEMLACYAYGRDRYSKRRLELGEGIVGTTFLEKETVLMTDVPNGYTEITSGLGESTPSSIMVVPLKTDDKVLGVIELASFNEFQAYEKEFVEKIAASIATSVVNVKVAEETTKLLTLSKDQTKKMKDQEDMMKQNIEELEATQEEAAFIRSQMEEELRNANLEIEKLKSDLAEN